MTEEKSETKEEVSLTVFLKSMFAILPICDFINLKWKNSWPKKNIENAENVPTLRPSKI